MIRPMLVITTLLLVAGCGKDSEEDVADRLESKGTMDVIDEASKNEYVAPEGNRMTESQIEMYLKVREREAKIAEVSRKQLEEHSKDSEENKGSVSGVIAGMHGLGSVADLLTADIRAAQELGYNTTEYQWVKERVLEASGDAYREQATRQMNSMLDQQYAAAKEGLEKAATDDEKKMYEQAIRGIEEMRASNTAETQDPWIAPNRQLLEKHEDALKALELEYAKYQGEPQAEAAEVVEEPQDADAEADVEAEAE